MCLLTRLTHQDGKKQWPFWLKKHFIMHGRFSGLRLVWSDVGLCD